MPISTKGLWRHTMMCYTLSSASTTGTRQWAALEKHDAALHQFPPALLLIWAQLAEKSFLKKSEIMSLENIIQRLNTKALAVINTTFDPPYFSLDNTFKR